MSHDSHHDEPEPPKKQCHGPHDCYGMPAKRFWRIVWSSSVITLLLVVAAALLANAL